MRLRRTVRQKPCPGRHLLGARTPSPSVQAPDASASSEISAATPTLASGASLGPQAVRVAEDGRTRQRAKGAARRDGDASGRAGLFFRTLRPANCTIFVAGGVSLPLVGDPLSNTSAAPAFACGRPASCFIFSRSAAWGCPSLGQALETTCRRLSPTSGARRVIQIFLETVPSPSRLTLGRRCVPPCWRR
jgi:hypothetical protein